MGLLSGLFGLASDVDVDSIKEELEPILIPEEEVELAFAMMRDQIVFTDRRIVFIDKQGMTGRKKNYLSVPYRSITMFSIETAGSFDADAEMRLWISGQGEPIKHELSRGSNVPGIQKALAKGMLGKR
ncbi:MAG: PH domain-containing protein [Paracoccaceae bacterium]